jgi:hypothetical protein
VESFCANATFAAGIRHQLRSKGGGNSGCRLDDGQRICARATRYEVSTGFRPTLTNEQALFVIRRR